MTKTTALRLAGMAIVTVLSLGQTLYFARINIGEAATTAMDDISVIAPFFPLAIAYGLDVHPLIGVPFNLILAAMFMLGWHILPAKPMWRRATIVFVVWALISAVGSWLVYRAVWNV